MLAVLLEDTGLTTQEAARQLHVSRQQVHAITAKSRTVTPDMALRLARLFGGGAELWLTLQQRYDLEHVRVARAHEIESIKELCCD